MRKIDKLFLKVVMLFGPVFEKAGVDIYQLELILSTKLTIDARRPPAMMMNRKRAIAAQATIKDPTRTSWLSVVMPLIMGTLYGALLFVFPNRIMGLTLYFSVFMLMMSLVLITDFTAVLIDVRDQYIILPRPVSDRTASMARIMHITIYVMRLALMQGLPAMIMIGFLDGILAVPLFFFQVIEATMMSIFTVNMVYLLLMRSVSPQKVKDIISYFQIFFTIIIFVVFRMPRLFNFLTLINIDLLSYKWTYVLAPVWIASLNETLMHHERATFIAQSLALVGLVAPLISIWLVAKVLAPGFNRSLAIMAMSDGGSSSSSKTTTVKGPGFIGRIANFLAPDPIENAGFRITWKLAARTRDFKMRVYPSFAYLPAYFMYLIFSTHTSDTPLSETKAYIFLLYIGAFMTSLLLQNVAISEKYKAAWVYYAMPIHRPGKILGGMYKALIAIYFVPYYLVISIIVLVIWGPGTINDLLLAFFLNQVFGMMMALFLVKGLPFSRPIMNRRGGSRGYMSLFVLALAGAVGFGHYVLAQWENLIWVCVVIAAVLTWVMFNYYRKQSWDNIEMAEMGE